MSQLPIEPLGPKSAGGRSFVGRRKVRLGDVDGAGRLRLDALTRYTQDVSDDDTTDAGLDPEPGWVVRSTVVDELAPAELGEWLEFETFCSGLGSCWAERRLSIAADGGSGARYEVATLWVCVDAAAGRPHRLTEQFLDIYGPAAGGRRVKARLRNPPPLDGGDRSRRRPWQLRAADVDVYQHVNNAAYWAVVEEWAERWSGPRRIRLEYGDGLDAGLGRADIAVDAVDGGQGYWWFAPDGPEPAPDPVLASALVTAIESDVDR